jgi:hypothetical protein
MAEIDDIVQIVCNIRQPAGDIAELVFHSQILTPGVSDNADVLSDFQTYFGIMAVGWQVVASTGHEWVDIDVRLQIPPNNFTSIGTEPIGISGLALTDALPPYAAVLVTRQVFASRGVAKKYYPGITEGQQDAGIIDPVNLVSWAAVGGVWNDNPQDVPGTNLDYQWVTKPTDYRVANVIQPGGFVNPVLSLQGRRKQGVGS